MRGSILARRGVLAAALAAGLGVAVPLARPASASDGDAPAWSSSAASSSGSGSAEPPALPAPSSSAPPASSDGAVPDAAPEVGTPRAAAKDLFRRGMALLKAGDMERALDLLLQSRKLYASKGNTLNAAICLDRLGRYDEALSLYEEAIVSFGATLDEEDRAALPGVMERLRGKVGSLDVAADVTGAIVLIDGRERARLPITMPIRVMPGQRLVRVLKDGYQAWEQQVEIAVGKTLKVDARLHALEASGGLRVEATALDGATVTVDGVELGESPWEGTLAPGQHVISVRKGDVGSAPTRVVVLAGQTALVRLKAGPFGAPLIVRAHPEEAQIRLGAGVVLGAGSWTGPLPEGEYDLELRAEGYHSRRVHVRVVKGVQNKPLDVTLDIDPTHPRWPKKVSGRLLLGGVGGIPLGRSLGSTAERACPASCTDASVASGVFAGVRGGYELPMHLAIELAAGYLSLSRSVSRQLEGPVLEAPDGSTALVTYALDDVIRARGVWLTGGASFQAPLAGSWHWLARASVGAFFPRSADATTGTASTRTGSVPVAIEHVNDEVSSTALLIVPEVGAYTSTGDWRFGASLGALLLPMGGPEFPRGALTVSPACSTPTSAGCAGDSDALQHERAHGAFGMLLPQLFATYQL